MSSTNELRVDGARDALDEPNLGVLPSSMLSVYDRFGSFSLIGGGDGAVAGCGGTAAGLPALK